MGERLFLPWTIDEEASEFPREGCGNIVVSDSEGGIALLLPFALDPIAADGRDTEEFARRLAAQVCAIVNAGPEEF